MFTGIVEEVGRVKNATTVHLSLVATKVIKSLKPGDSIAVKWRLSHGSHNQWSNFRCRYLA